MKLTPEEVALLRRVVEWRRANGWMFGFYPTRGEAAWKSDRWFVEADIYPDSVQLIVDGETSRRLMLWPSSVAEAADVLAAIGVLPVTFSSAFQAGVDRDEWRVVAGPTAFPTVFEDEIRSEEHLEVVLRNAANRWRSETIWVQHRRMPTELSESCFDDHCRSCLWPGCGCRCHTDQVYDDGWRDKPEPKPEPEVRILSWDHREQIDIEDLAEAVHEISGCRAHIYSIDTNSDQYAIVISGPAIGAKEAHRIYLADYYEGDIPPEAEAWLDGLRQGLTEEAG